MSDVKPGADHFWQELSYGNINLAGSTQHDWLPMAGNRADYFVDGDVTNNAQDNINLGLLATDCTAAHDSTVDFGSTIGINLMFNDGIGCCAWGGGIGNTLDGKTGFSTTWMPPWSWGTTSHGVLGQEMGHAFGLPHEGCQGTTSPYDSQWDVQSAARQVHTNAQFKDQLNWISNSRRFVSAGALNETVQLQRLALPGLNNQDPGYLMAKIPTNDGDLNTFYVVEARKFAGYDESPQSIPGEAVLIHAVDLNLGDKTAQVVVGSGACNGEGGKWLPGELFEDPINNISIAVVSEWELGFNIVINPLTDVRVTKTASPDPAVAGDLLTYNVRVQNLGPGPATNVVVQDTLPAGVTYVADTDSCTGPVAQVLTCTLGSTLPVNGLWTFGITVAVNPNVGGGAPTTITNNVNVVADQDSDPNATNNNFELNTLVVTKADLMLSKDCKPDQPGTQLAGTPTFCEIYVDNQGPSDAKNVEVIDEIISNTPVTITSYSLTSTSGSAGSCLPAVPVGPTMNTTITCTDALLPAGARNTIRIEFVANDGGDVDDTASVSSDTPDPDTSNNSASDGVSFIANADLSLVKTALPDPVIAGANLTYDITATNNGPSTALGVVITDDIPAGVTVVSVTPGAGNSCVPGVPGDASQPLTCNMGDISNGLSESVTVLVNVNPDVPNGTILLNRARVSSDSNDPNNGNNEASDATDVNASADLEVTKADSPDPVLAGQTLKYTVTITNNGPSTAIDVALTDTLPADVSFVGTTISNGSGTCSLLATTVTCDLNDLGPGQFVTVIIEVLVDPSVSDSTVIDNTATASSATADPVGNNNSATQSTTVNAEADVRLLKDATFTTASPSSIIEYMITVINDGPSDALDVVVVDTLPRDPKKLVFVADTLDPGRGSCTYDSTAVPHMVTCTLGILVTGDSVTFAIHVRPKGRLDLITNTATVSSDTTDPNVANNTDTKDVLVKGGSNKPKK